MSHEGNTQKEEQDYENKQEVEEQKNNPRGENNDGE